MECEVGATSEAAAVLHWNAMATRAASRKRALPLERGAPLDSEHGRACASTPQTQPRRRILPQHLGAQGGQALAAQRGSADEDVLLGAQGGQALAAQRGSADEHDQGEGGGAPGLHAKSGGLCAGPSYKEVTQVQKRLFDVLNGSWNIQRLTASLNQVAALSLSCSRLSAHARLSPHDHCSSFRSEQSKHLLPGRQHAQRVQHCGKMHSQEGAGR